VRVHPYISAWLEQIARVAMARQREDEIRELLEQGLKLAEAGKKQEAAAILRKVEKLRR
jgi:hypothetical protein